MLVKLQGIRSGFTGTLAGVSWVEGKARVNNLSQRLIRGYSVVEDVDDYAVGKDLPERIITNPSGNIVPNAYLEDLKSTVVDFNLEANSTDGFGELLEANEGKITSIIKVAKEQKEAEDGAKELSQIVADKKAEIEQAANKKLAPKTENVPKTDIKRSEVLSQADFKGKGSYGKYLKYVKEVTGTSPRDKEQCAEVLAVFKASLEN